MLLACYRSAMSNLQIKNVPEALHVRLRERAAAEGTSMRDYVLRVLEGELRLDSLDEWFEEAEQLEPLASSVSTGEIVDLIEEGREERTQQILDAISERRQGDD